MPEFCIFSRFFSDEFLVRQMPPAPSVLHAYINNDRHHVVVGIAVDRRLWNEDGSAMHGGANICCSTSTSCVSVQTMSYHHSRKI